MTLTWLLGVALAGAPSGPPPTSARVASVYDGDTFTLETGDKIRLKWVNTPELKPHEPYGEEARDLTKRLVEDTVVQLVMDEPNPRDGYGRVVAGIRTSQGQDLSLELIRAGMGHLFVIPPDHLDLTPYLAAQAQARAERRGIWTTTPFSGALHFTSFHANASGPDEENVNGEYMRVANITTDPVNLKAYRIQTRAGATYALPDLVVPAGHTVLVKSGKGSHQTDPRFQLEAFLGSDTPIWADDYDMVTLIDAQGATVDQRGSK